MAVFSQPTAAAKIFENESGPPPPAGTYFGRCIDVRDVFGVQRTKFESTEVETVDLTAFLFEFQHPTTGQIHRVSTRPMKISGHEKSGLYKFLMGWLGKPAEYGWDYCSMSGKAAMITLTNTPSRNNPGVIYADVASVAQIPLGYPEPPLLSQPRVGGQPSQAMPPQQPAYQPPPQQQMPPPQPAAPPAYQPPPQAPPPPPGYPQPQAPQQPQQPAYANAYPGLGYGQQPPAPPLPYQPAPGYPPPPAFTPPPIPGVPPMPAEYHTPVGPGYTLAAPMSGAPVGAGFPTPPTAFGKVDDLPF